MSRTGPVLQRFEELDLSTNQTSSKVRLARYVPADTKLKELIDALYQEFMAECRVAVGDAQVQKQARALMSEAHAPLYRSLLPCLIELTSKDQEFNSISQETRTALLERFDAQVSEGKAISFVSGDDSSCQDQVFWNRLSDLKTYLESQVDSGQKLEMFIRLEAFEVLLERNPNLAVVFDLCDALCEAFSFTMPPEEHAAPYLAGLLSLGMLSASHLVTERYDPRLVKICRDSLRDQAARHLKVLGAPRVNARDAHSPQDPRLLWELLKQEIDTRGDAEACRVWNRLSQGPHFAAIASLYEGHFDYVRSMFSAYCSVVHYFEGTAYFPGDLSPLESADQSFIAQLMAPFLHKLPAPLAKNASRKGLVAPSQILLHQDPLLWALDMSIDCLADRESRTRVLFAILERFETVPLQYSTCMYDSIRRRHFGLLGEIDWMFEGFASINDFWRNVTYSEDSVERFHEGLNHALHIGRAQGSYGIEAVAFGHFLLTLAAFPDYANETTWLVSAIHSRISLEVANKDPLHTSVDLGIISAPASHRRHRERELHIIALATVTALYLVADAMHQGRPLREAKFCDANESRWLSIEELLDQLKAATGPDRMHFLERWAYRISRPGSFWDSIYVGLHKIGYKTPECYRYIRAFVEPDVFTGDADFWHLGAETFEFSINEWTCFSAASKYQPAANEIAMTVYALLFYRKPKTTEIFKRFDALMRSLPDPNWTKHLPLSQAATLYITYLETYEDRPDNKRSPEQNDRYFRQMLLSLGSLGAEAGGQQRVEELHRCPDQPKWLLTREAEVARHLTATPQTVSPYDPLDVLFAAAILGVDSSTNKGIEASVHHIFKKVSVDILEGRTEPLHSTWIAKDVTLIRTRAVSENLAVHSVKEVVERRLDEIELCRSIDRKRGDVSNLRGGSLSEKEEAFSKLLSYSFLSEMHRRPPYDHKLDAMMIGRSANRSTLLHLIEVFMDGCNGGKNNNIACVTDSTSLAQLREELELDRLLAGVRVEYAQHEDIRNVKGTTLNLSFRPTRGVLMEFVGHLCDTCFSRVLDISARAPFMTFVPFIKNPEATGKDGVYPRFAGGSLVIEAQAVSETGTREKVLIIRGFNPSSSLFKSVRASDLFEAFADYLVEIGRAQGVRHIVIPNEWAWGLAFTNRPYAFLHAEELYYKEPKATRMKVVVPKSVEVNFLPVEDVVVVRTV